MTPTPQQLLWLAIIVATVDIDNASNARRRSEKQSYRDGMLAAYSIIIDNADMDELAEQLQEAITNLH